MCRLLAYVGDPILLAHLVLWPDRSIIKQSYDAQERKMNPSLPSHLCHGNLNGDGFGIGWYSQEGSDTSPCVFTSVTPAWNNDNLARLSRKITSQLIFAHVRAAYPGMPVSEQNCHPFMWGRYMWMHNGVVGGFSKIKRRIVALLSDEAYNTVASFHSDSAASFALFLHHLPSMTAPQSPDVLLQAMQRTLASIASVQEEMEATSETSLLNFVVSDGNTVIATRYVSPDTEEPASLYFAEGSSFQREMPAQESTDESPTISSIHGESQYELTYGVRGTCVAIVASEPITGSRSDWVAVPKNTCVVISREKSGFVNIMKTPRTCDGQEEVSRCLEAVSRGIGVTARQWTFRDGRQGSVGSDAESCMMVDRPDHNLTGHTAAILYMELEPEGKRLFSSSADGTIKVWDVETCTLLATLEGHGKPVLKLAVYGNHLYSTGGSRIRVWDLKTYRCVYLGHVVPGSGALRALAVSKGTIHVGGQDSIVKNLRPDSLNFGPDTMDEELVTTSSSSGKWSHLSAVHSIETCGKYICSAGGDSMIRVWRADTLEHVRVLRGHRGSILTLKGMDNLLYSGGRDNTVRVWDMEALLCRRLLAGHKDDITHISAYHEPRKDASLGKHRHTPSLHQMGHACFVASASADCTVRVWCPATWSCILIVNLRTPGPAAGPTYVPNGYSSDAAPLAVAVSKQHIITGTRNGMISLWSGEDLSKKLQKIASGEIEAQILNGKELLESVDSGSLEGSTGDLVALEKRRLERELGNLLREFVAIRTISGNMCCKEDCFKASKFVARLLENLGAEVKLVRVLDDKNPVVIGRLGQRQDRPTVTFYGHYDVQPASEPQWRTDPFEVHAVDGYLYGRGVSDNKGPILAFIHAVREMLVESNGCEGLPVNVAFFFEGEEENGSKGTVEALQQNLRWFEGTVLTVISNSQWVGENVPCLTYGMRGMVSLNLEVRGPNRDLHSGNDGGVFNEPMADLIKVLSTLVDSQNNIQVPHFYDGVKPSLLDAAWQSLKDSNEFALDDYKEALGVPALTPQGSKHQLLSVRWCQPTLSIVDVCARPVDSEGPCSYHRFGPTRFSVIPHAAVGKVSMRFVPKQDKDAMASCLTKHVEHEFAKLRSKNKISIAVVTAGDWWEANLESKFVKMTERAIRREWGQDPLYVREGGTMPLTSTFEKVLGAPAMHIPMGQASDNCHLANERIRWANLLCGKNVIRHLLEEVGAL